MSRRDLAADVDRLALEVARLGAENRMLIAESEQQGRRLRELREEYEIELETIRHQLGMRRLHSEQKA